MSNFGRQIQKDYERAVLQTEELTRENDALRKTSQEWQKKYADLEARIEAIVERAVAKATAPLLAEIAQLKEENATLHAEVSRLKAIINKDSNNSSMPPSANGFKKIPNNRESSGRKQGGQKGHTGHCLKLPENLDELAQRGEIELIDVDLAQGAAQWRYTYSIDFKVVRVITRTKRALGSPHPYLSYGINVVVLSILLHCKEFVSLSRVSEIISYMSGGMIEPEPSTINNFIDQAQEPLSKRYEEIKQDVLNSEVLHTDETPVRSTVKEETDEKGESKLSTAVKTTYSIFIRVYCTLRAVFYTVNAHKGDAGVEADGILPRFIGTVIHDHDAKLYKYGSRHGTCNAHLLRDLLGLVELWKLSWAERMRSLLLEMKAYKDQDISGSEPAVTCCDMGTYGKFSARWDECVQDGKHELAQMQEGGFGYNELRKMLARLTAFKANHMLFLAEYSVPFTNNLAERDLRPCKLKQNISKTFRSWNGAKRYAVLSSVIASALRRNQPVFSALASLLPLGG